MGTRENDEQAKCEEDRLLQAYERFSEDSARDERTLSEKHAEQLDLLSTQVTELSAVLKVVFKKVTSIESAYGHALYYPSAKKESWNRRVEETFAGLLCDFDWDTRLDREGCPERFYLGQIQYERIMQLAAGLSPERLILLWERHAKRPLTELLNDLPE